MDLSKANPALHNAAPGFLIPSFQLSQPIQLSRLIREGLQSQVEDKLGVWLEPSIQGGMGEIWIYSNDDDSTLAEDIDYQGFNETVLDAAYSSKNKTEFMKWYKSYLESLIGE